MQIAANATGFEWPDENVKTAIKNTQAMSN